MDRKSAEQSTFTVSNYGNNIFIIDREGDLTASQTVYYRTVSGTALGGIHFKPVNDSVLFAPGESRKEVTVTEIGCAQEYTSQDNEKYPATAYQCEGRTYYLQVYKVEGKIAAILEDGMGKRLMPLDKMYKVSRAKLTGVQEIYSNPNEQELKESTSINGKPQLHYEAGCGELYWEESWNYIKLTADSKNVRVQFDYRDSSWYTYRYLLIGNDADLSFARKVPIKTDGSFFFEGIPAAAKYVVCYGRNDVNSSEYSTFCFPGEPMPDTEEGIYSIHDVYPYHYLEKKEIPFALMDEIHISMLHFQKEDGLDTGYCRNLHVNATLKSNTPPRFIEAAALADTVFQQGEIFLFSLVFDRIVRCPARQTIKTNLSGKPFEYVSGDGTNVLLFKGNVDNADATELILYNPFPNGVADIYGTVSNTLNGRIITAFEFSVEKAKGETK